MKCVVELSVWSPCLRLMKCLSRFVARKIGVAWCLLIPLPWSPRILLWWLGTLTLGLIRAPRRISHGVIIVRNRTIPWTPAGSFMVNLQIGFQIASETMMVKVFRLHLTLSRTNRTLPRVSPKHKWINSVAFFLPPMHRAPIWLAKVAPWCRLVVWQHKVSLGLLIPGPRITWLDVRNFFHHILRVLALTKLKLPMDCRCWFNSAEFLNNSFRHSSCS